MLHFFQFKNLNSNMKRTKINKKRLGLAHISWKIHYICRDLMSAKPNIGKDASSVTRKNRQMSMKVAQKWFHHAIISIREQCYKHILVVKGFSFIFVAFLFNLEAPLRLPSVWPDKNCTNVYKSCPKMISLDKWMILTPLQKLPKNVGDLGKLIAAKGFKKMPKVQ